MAKFRIHYSGSETEDVVADKFVDSKNFEWIEFFQGSGQATKLVLRVKAEAVVKIRLVA
jgi:hypothetical protein